MIITAVLSFIYVNEIEKQWWVVDLPVVLVFGHINTLADINGVLYEHVTIFL